MQTLHAEELWGLKQLQGVGYNSAVIGGGAVRDAYFDLYPNDIDIFVWDSGSSSELIDVKFKTLDERSLTVLFDLQATAIDNDPDALDDFFDMDFNLFGDNDSIRKLGQTYDGRTNHIVSVYSIYKSEFQVEYQVIVVNKPPKEYVTKHFDIGLCMCYCDGNRMRFTNEFLSDATNKTLTICGQLTEKEYQYTINHHVLRMKQRFPDFTIVDNLKGTF